MIFEGYIPMFAVCIAQDFDSDSHAARESVARTCSVMASHMDADTQMKGSAWGE